MNATIIRVALLITLPWFLQGCLTSFVVEKARNEVKLHDPVKIEETIEGSVRLLCYGKYFSYKAKTFTPFYVDIPEECLANAAKSNPSDVILWPNLNCAIVRRTRDYPPGKSTDDIWGGPVHLYYRDEEFTLASGPDAIVRFGYRPWVGIFIPFALLGDAVIMILSVPFVPINTVGPSS